MISQAPRIHESTVLRHLNDLLDNEKLAPENGGSGGHFSAQQTAELIEFLSLNTFPSTISIIAHVQELWGITFTIPGMNKWLHRNGFSYKKPTGTPHKFSEEKQQNFIKAYKELRQSSGDEPILFIDAVHPTQSTKLSCGWIRRGERKIVNTTGGRTRLNIMGVLNLNAIERTVIREYPQIDVESICKFFIAIRESYPVRQRIHIILDGAGYHRADFIRDWAFIMNIELHFLPPYRPNFNPIEQLWKVMNEQVRNNRYFATARHFRAEIMAFFKETLPGVADNLYSRINDNFQCLKSASSS